MMLFMVVFESESVYLLSLCLRLSGRRADQGYDQFRQAAEQIAHSVCAVREEGLPHTEEEVRQLCLPLSQEKKV